MLKKTLELYGAPNSLNKISNRSVDYEPRDPYGNLISSTERSSYQYNINRRENTDRNLDDMNTK